jgi:hypothetical protein
VSSTAAMTKVLLQIFSKTVIGPIFFEFIQRKGDDGFGEGNFRALFESDRGGPGPPRRHRGSRITTAAPSHAGKEEAVACAVASFRWKISGAGRTRVN